MKKLLLIGLAIASISLYQNCSGRHEMFDNGVGQSSTGTGFEDVDMVLSLAAFERSVYPIIQEAGMCVDCHGVSTQPLHATSDVNFSHDVWISFGLVNLRDPANSLAVIKMGPGEGHLNARGNIDDTTAGRLQDAIQAWSDELVANGGLIGVGTGIQPTFTSIYTNILEPRCLSCHQPGQPGERVDYTDYVTTINTGGVDPGSHSTSLLFTETASGNEPRDGSGELDTDELNAIQTWINRGALNN